MTTDTTAAAPLGLASLPNLANGSFTSDGNATSINVGFNPRVVMIYNATDVVKWEKYQGMAAADAIKTVAAGTMTEDTTSAVLIGADAGLNEPGSGILLSAALCGTGKTIVWYAFG